jgi:hypothetical protein
VAATAEGGIVLMEKVVFGGTRVDDIRGCDYSLEPHAQPTCAQRCAAAARSRPTIHRYYTTDPILIWYLFTGYLYRF